MWGGNALCLRVPGAGHRPSPGLPGAAEQPDSLHPALPTPELCCWPGGCGWDIIIIIITNQLLETGFQQLFWVLGSFPSHPWAARSSGVADTASSLPLALPPATARTA